MPGEVRPRAVPALPAPIAGEVAGCEQRNAAAVPALGLYGAASTAEFVQVAYRLDHGSQSQGQLVPGVRRPRVQVLDNGERQFVRCALPHPLVGDGNAEPCPAWRLKDSVDEFVRVRGESVHACGIEQYGNRLESVGTKKVQCGSRRFGEPMRQVDRPELTYSVFASLRHWTHTTRRDVFAPIAKRRQVSVWLAAQVVADKLRLSGVELWSPATGEPLPRDGLTAVIEAAIDAFPGAIGKLWLSGVRQREQEARSTAANLITDALDPFQVLTNAPFGTTLFFPDMPRHELALAPTWP